jgi:serine/threonine protein kinase
LSRNNVGCAGYLSPERIDPPDPTKPFYDIRADVWSLGISLVELATGEYPYKSCQSEFEVMSTILEQDAPKLEGNQFSDIFKSFVQQCLIKEVKKRPKYNTLLQHPFVQKYKNENVDVKSWFIAETKMAAAENKLKNLNIKDNNEAIVPGESEIQSSLPKAPTSILISNPSP